MTILVDECIWPWRGRRWCHLVSDESLDELHDFAARLGMPRRIFQGDHYDLHEDLRAMALAGGAIALSSRELLGRLRAAGLRLSPGERRNWAGDDRSAPFGLDRTTRQVYEERVDDYIRLRPPARLEEARAFAQRCLPGRVVADLGCGPGSYLPVLPDPTIGVDIAAPMLSRAAVAAPAAGLLQADLESLPFAPQSLGGAWSRNGHVHIPSGRFPWALAQLQRAMAVDAPLFLSLVRGDRDGPSADDHLAGRFFARWSAERVRDVVIGAGFAVEDIADEASGNVVVRATRVRTLADSVGPAMRLLVCGLNPSVVAADAGVGFAGATNRFWPAAVTAGLVDAPRSLRHALLDRGVGMTDLVKRATPKSAEVTRAEYAAGLERMARLVDWLRPGVVCMVGLEGWRAATDRRAPAGWQERQLGTRPVYVMPSTSGLNAGTSMAALVEHLRAALAGPTVR